MESLTETDTPDSEPIEPCHDNPQQKPHTAVSQSQMGPATPKPASNHKLHTRVDGLPKPDETRHAKTALKP